MSKLQIQNMVLGAVATNVYFLKNTETGEMLVVDPSDRADLIEKKIIQMEGRLVGILLTHGHFDHIMAVNDLKEKFNVPVYGHVDEQKVFEDPNVNMSTMLRIHYKTSADVLLKDEEIFEAAGFQIRVLHTPGHTCGSCCYEIPEEKVLMSGDTLFAGSYGRIDFPTGSARQMKSSIQRLLQELPEDTLVYPGHEMQTDIAMEKRYNPLA